MCIYIYIYIYTCRYNAYSMHDTVSVYLYTYKTLVVCYDACMLNPLHASLSV